MYLILIVVCLGLYLALRPHAEAGEYHFVIGAFMSLGYIAGFMEARRAATTDETAVTLPNE